MASNNQTPTENVISVRGLETGFGAETVHEDLDLDVKRGEIIGIVGGSGTGKTVLLKAIIGLLPLRAGKVEIAGRDQATMSGEEEQLARRDWGVMFQDGALFSSLSVAQNVQVPMREHYKLGQGLMDDITTCKVKMVGLPRDAAPKLPSDLSGGMRKRASLARALALDPGILFLDEPTAGLDPIGAAAFDQLILDLRDALDLTVFLVTHDLDTLYTICDRVAVLGEKRILKVAPIKDLLDVDNDWIQEYFKGPRARAVGIGAEGEK